MSGIQRHDFIDWADQYLREELLPEDAIAFENFCKENPSYAELFEQHRAFVQSLQQTELRNAFQQALITEADNFESDKSKPVRGKVYPLWSKLQVNVGVAAVVALASVFSTLGITGYFTNIKKANTDYSELRREVNSVKKNVNEQTKAIQNINNDKNKNASAIHFGATGFMLTRDGYVVTNYHVINGADSIHLQNVKGQAYKAQIVYTDAQKDIAILHIDDVNFKTLKSIPYTFKKQNSELGEEIFTLGFPRDEAVYGQGYLSSHTGYAGDTVAYQISIPVNPGNSGGPVLDNQGNIIGIISGKQKGIDGAAFAIKTKELVGTLNKIPADSLKGNIFLNNKNALSTLPRTEQIKKLQEYIYIVKVF